MALTTRSSTTRSKLGSSTSLTSRCPKTQLGRSFRRPAGVVNRPTSGGRTVNRRLGRTTRRTVMTGRNRRSLETSTATCGLIGTSPGPERPSKTVLRNMWSEQLQPLRTPPPISTKTGRFSTGPAGTWKRPPPATDQRVEVMPVTTAGSSLTCQSRTNRGISRSTRSRSTTPTRPSLPVSPRPDTRCRTTRTTSSPTKPTQTSLRGLEASASPHRSPSSRISTSTELTPASSPTSPSNRQPK